jgi:hypothetical protein
MKKLQSQAGATLIIALAFTTVIMSITVAVLAFARAGTNSVHAYQVERNRRYAADGALQSAVLYAAKDSALGVTGSTKTCEMAFNIREALLHKGESAVATPGVLVVTCEATPTSLTGGATSGLGDPQEARDVTFTVKCKGTTPSAGDAHSRLTCQSGSVYSKTLATARVRFEPDYTMTKVPGAPGTTSANDRSKRAIIPKIISWNVKN